MTEINFQPVFDYIDQNNVVLKEDILLEVREEIRPLKTAIANLAGDVKTIKEEMVISNHRTKRLEEWAGPVGKKVGLPLEL